MNLRALVVFSLLAVMLMVRAPGRLAAVGLPPQVNEPVIGNLVGGQVSITGMHFGLPTSQRSVRFNYDGLVSTLSASSPLVQSWLDTSIQFTLPIEVHSGTMTVIVDGQSSNAVDTFIYALTTRSLPVTAGTNGKPVGIAVTADNRVWVNEEFHTELKSLSPDSTQPPLVRRIPSPSTGIFADNSTGADRSTQISVLGEDIDAQGDGSVWFTEGGGYLYGGQHFNTSRIVRYEPAADRFSCYNVPIDDAQVIGVLLDAARGVVWYSEGSLTHGNAISSFSLSGAVSDCAWDPLTSTRAPLCSVQQVPSCHQRHLLPNNASQPANLVLDPAGNVWFVEFWGNRIGRLTPESGVFVELPLPAPIVRQGPGTFAGSGPFELAFDASGSLWVTESFDATIDRVRPDRMSPANFNCTQLDLTGKNPCIDEIFVGSNGIDGKTVHTVSVGQDGLVWFTYMGQSSMILFAAIGNSTPDAKLGFIDTNKNNFVVLMPTLPNVIDLGGVEQHPLTRDVWFTEYSSRKIGRLEPASGDGDGIPDAIDNCPTVYNPGQENHDAYVDLAPFGFKFNDATAINSDTLGDACDTDDDNDGLPDSVETSGPPCASATGPTDPLKSDTDGDGVLDGAECALGSNPNDPNSKPAALSIADDPDRDGLSTAFENTIGTDPNVRDTDGDGLSDGVEYKNYNSNPLSTNTDGDLCGDAKEVSSVNGDYVVNSADLAIVASAFGTSTSGRYVPDFDPNKDGAINAGDLAFVAHNFGTCP